jgi:serine/threonine-protein kinase RIO1
MKTFGPSDSHIRSKIAKLRKTAGVPVDSPTSLDDIKEAKVLKTEKAELKKVAAKLKRKQMIASGEATEATFKDPEVTKSKLKGLLQSGGFKFNAKEREALGQILT